MVYQTSFKQELTERAWSVYVIAVAKSGKKGRLLYVGKTGDNNRGCNTLLSRIGNHASFSGTHTQLRDKVLDTWGCGLDSCQISLFWSPLDAYKETDEKEVAEEKRNRTNEAERELNRRLKKIVESKPNAASLSLLNPYEGTGVSANERAARELLLTRSDKTRLTQLVNEVVKHVA